MRKYTAAPHPFLLEASRAPENDVHQVGLTLIGRGSVYLSYLIHAFRRAGEQGLGKGRAPMMLMDVWQAEPAEADTWVLIYHPGGVLKARPPGVPSVPPLPPAIRLRLETPLRLQRDEHLVTPETFRFSDLFGSLFRRVSGAFSRATSVTRSPIWTAFTRKCVRASTTKQASILSSPPRHSGSPPAYSPKQELH